MQQALDTHKERGATIGATRGAIAEGLIGRANGSTARGAILGAVVGGTAGAVIGHQMDQRAKTLQQNIKGATVERVGEGILVTFDSGLLHAFNSDAGQPAAQSNLRELTRSFASYRDTQIYADDALKARARRHAAAAAAL